MRTSPTAGQASTEYVAAIALVVGILVLAAPAVGAPDLARAVAGKVRLALCVVGGDVCSPRMATAAGLAPCPLRSRMTGHEATATAFSIELGHRLTLTVTPQSDGSVAVVRAAGGIAGVSGGLGGEASRGPVSVELGATGTVRQRVQVARGWRFPDRRTADHFLAHALVNSLSPKWPADWESVENAGELTGMAGVAVGSARSGERGDLLGAAAGGQAGLGARLTRAGRVVTVYGRLAWDGPEGALPLVPSLGLGRKEWLAEYSFGRDGPRELVFRHAAAGKVGSEVTETVMRLDLRDPENLAAARPLLDMRMPWGRRERGIVEAVVRRIAEDGTIERTVSSVRDDSRGVSGSLRGGAKFGGAVKRIAVRHRLVSATARTGGPYDRERVDCQR